MDTRDDQTRQQATAAEEPVHLLFVDDEPELLGSLSEALRCRGIDVATATSCEEALRHLSAHTIDVALVDAKMPGMDDMALLQHIKQLQPFTEVLVLTGHPSLDLAREGIKDGLCDLLMKPQNPDILAERIRAARRVGRQRSQLQHRSSR